MKREKQQRGTCPGKLKYGTLLAASGAAKVVNANRVYAKDKLEAYHCSACDRYHTGHIFSLKDWRLVTYWRTNGTNGQNLAG